MKGYVRYLCFLFAPRRCAILAMLFACQLRVTQYVCRVEACTPTVYMHSIFMCLCVCDFISVWPFKRFLQGRGGREDNGSRHYLLLSCRLSVRPHTLWPSLTWTPSGCTCAHVPNIYCHPHVVVQGQRLCMQGLISTCSHSLHRKSRKPTCSRTHTDEHWARTQFPSFQKKCHIEARVAGIYIFLSWSFSQAQNWMVVWTDPRKKMQIWFFYTLMNPPCAVESSFVYMWTCMLLVLYTATACVHDSLCACFLFMHSHLFHMRVCMC